MGEGVGRQVAAVSLGARSPVTARHPQPRGPTPGSPVSTQGWDTFLPVFCRCSLQVDSTCQER